LSLSLIAAACVPCIASESGAAVGSNAQAATAPESTERTAPVPARTSTITIAQDGAESTFATTARTVADVLAERGIRLAAEDALSPAPSTPLEDGTRIVIRSAIPLQLRVGTSIRAIRSAGQTVADVLRSRGVRVGASDVVTPALASALAPNEVVRVVHVRTWMSHDRVALEPTVVNRADPKLAAGTTKVVSPGIPGLRETVIRYTRIDEGDPSATVLGTRTLREPQPRVIAHGTAMYRSLARVAALGFASAMHMAGSALHMIATAYTAGCYGCSGITASGVRAGFGVIAVDPSVIPLGTKVFIPGYGHAIAGDTGGAIQGHRVDLGFDNVAAAIRFGRRPVMLYVLR
jgi:uncharacterized protein YabE (DUF348 family)